MGDSLRIVGGVVRGRGGREEEEEGCKAGRYSKSRSREEKEAGSVEIFHGAGLVYVLG